MGASDILKNMVNNMERYVQYLYLANCRICAKPTNQENKDKSVVIQNKIQKKKKKCVWENNFFYPLSLTFTVQKCLCGQ